MSARVYRLLQAILFFALAVLLLFNRFTGKLGWYIHQRFWSLTIFGALLFIAFGIVTIYTARRAPTEQPRTAWSLLALLLPLALALLVPMRPLSAQAVQNKGFESSIPAFAESSARGFSQSADQRNILDWLRILSAGENPKAYIGEPVYVTGFVYRDPRLSANQFMVGRFTILCCAADAFAIGLPVQSDAAAALSVDDWVKVKGIMQTTQIDGVTQWLIIAESVQPAEMPDQPYLFP